MKYNTDALVLLIVVSVCCVIALALTLQHIWPLVLVIGMCLYMYRLDQQERGRR